VVAEERPDLAVTTLGYDLESNNTAVTPPSKPAHGMSYNLVELLESYTPPTLPSGGGATEYAYDLDRALTEVLQPGPRLVEHTYDGAGRPETTTFPGGVVTRGYDTATGKLTTLAGPDVTLSSTYDGALLKAVAMTGPVAGTISWQHDTAFRVVEERVNGAHAATFAFDDDDLLTQAGGLTITRDPASGFVTQATAGLVTEAWTYNDYGEVETYTPRSEGSSRSRGATCGTTSAASSRRPRRRPPATRVLVYEYDLAARLAAVYEDGLLAESYGYDDNGNRLSSLNADGVFDAAFDDQDRLLEYGDDAFTWTDNGELYSTTDTASGDTTTFAYDATGNLRGVGLPDGRSRGVPRRRPRPAGRQAGERRARARVALARPAAARRGARRRGQRGREVCLRRRRQRAGADGDADGDVPVGHGPPRQRAAGDRHRDGGGRAGARLRRLGAGAAGHEPRAAAFWFAGGLYDPDTGLVRFGARDYDAETGRWTAKDPVRFGGGVNLYEYAASDPSNMRDPSGRDPELGEEGGWEGPAGPPEGFDPEGGDESLSELEGGTSFLDRLTDWFFAIVAGPTGCAEKERTYKQHIEICNKKLSDCMGRSNILSPRQCEICYDICRGRQEAPNGKEWPEYDHNGYSCDYRKKSGSR
jgi:RHS repeat-associated protein